MTRAKKHSFIMGGRKSKSVRFFFFSHRSLPFRSFGATIRKQFLIRIAAAKEGEREKSPGGVPSSLLLLYPGPLFLWYRTISHFRSSFLPRPPPVRVMSLPFPSFPLFGICEEATAWLLAQEKERGEESFPCSLWKNGILVYHTTVNVCGRCDFSDFLLLFFFSPPLKRKGGRREGVMGE